MYPEKNKRVFYALLANNLGATITNMFVWFALTFWAYIQTESVIVTGFIGGMFGLLSMFGAMPFGSITDHNKKKVVMVYSSLASLFFYIAGAFVFFLNSAEVFTVPTSIALWTLVVLLMCGTVAGNMRAIALSTTVSFLFEKGRDQANGLVGVVNGIGFSITSIFSGIAIGFFGFGFAVAATIIATVIVLLHMLSIKLEEQIDEDSLEEKKAFDLAKTIATIRTVPGLMALILFTTMNNLIGGVFMALLDAYGLSLVSVQTWGVMFAVASIGFIFGSALVARRGLGDNPLRLLLWSNAIAWFGAFIIAIQPWTILLMLGIIVWMTISPYIEAAEQTIIQAVVPYEKQGRVFGFAQSVESASQPMMAFLIGPITAVFFIPFMTTGLGADLIGSWFGTGPERGIAFVFTISGLIGLLLTFIAFKTKSYTILSNRYQDAESG